MIDINNLSDDVVEQIKRFLKEVRHDLFLVGTTGCNDELADFLTGTYTDRLTDILNSVFTNTKQQIETAVTENMKKSIDNLSKIIIAGRIKSLPIEVIGGYNYVRMSDLQGLVTPLLDKESK